jgi:CrcB protein
MIKNIFIVLIGGGVGSVFRYLVSLYLNKYVSINFPFSTFIVNIFGCLLIGIISGLFLKSNYTTPELKLLIVTGFCGGFTTFSAFAHENFNLIESGNFTLSLFYSFLSVFIGVFSVWIGVFISK